MSHTCAHDEVADVGLTDQGQRLGPGLLHGDAEDEQDRHQSGDLESDHQPLAAGDAAQEILQGDTRTAGPRRVLLQPHQADRARPGIGADHGAQCGSELDRRGRANAGDHLRDRLEQLRRGGMGEPDAQRGIRGRTLHELGFERGHDPRSAARPPDSMHLAVLALEDRLDAEKRSDHALGLADAAAAHQVLERVDAEDEPHARGEALDVGRDRLDGRALGEHPLHAQGAHRDADGCKLRVEHRHLARPLRGREARRAERARQLSRDVQGHDVLVPLGQELRVRGGELLGRRLGGPRRRWRRREALVELRRLQVDVVAQLL